MVDEVVDPFDALSTEFPKTLSPAPPWAEVDPRDPGVLQILAVEHSGLLSARSLVYNESFARVASFLTLISMSFVGLALVAQARGFDRDFLVFAGIAIDDVRTVLTSYSGAQAGVAAVVYSSRRRWG